MEPEYLTAKEVASRLRVSKMTVSRWCTSGELSAIRIGRMWRIPAEELQRFIAERAS